MDRFIVGTGRCGSTLLSRMVGEHPAVCSIFEFFNGLDMTRRFRDEPATGDELAALISQEHPFLTMVLKRGYEVVEVTYPFGEGARYTRQDGVPWVLVSALPRLSGDPDALFDETLAFARSLPARHLAEQYRALFDWWTERLRRACWIERSGSSIDYLGALLAFFPHARFLHIHRDGREAALSMREHAAYRLAIALMYQIPAGDVRTNVELGALDAGDEITQLLESRPPIEYFGRYWSQELERGLRALDAMAPGQYAEVRFEDLVADPAPALRRLAEFFELDPDAGGWTERAAALVRAIPPARFPTLAPDEQARLDEACRPGMRLLGRSA